MNLSLEGETFLRRRARVRGAWLDVAMGGMLVLLALILAGLRQSSGVPRTMTPIAFASTLAMLVVSAGGMAAGGFLDLRGARRVMVRADRIELAFVGGGTKSIAFEALATAFVRRRWRLSGPREQALHLIGCDGTVAAIIPGSTERFDDLATLLLSRLRSRR